MSILYSSYHNYLDFSSGAAISTREVLRELARRGRRVRVLCGSFFDVADFGERDFYRTLASLKLQARIKESKVAFSGETFSYRLVSFEDDGIEATTIFFDESPQFSAIPHYFSKRRGLLYARLFLDELRALRPKVYATYGGYPIARSLAVAARREGVATAFFLHNANYRDRKLFEAFDEVVVPSDFLRRFYRPILDRDATIIPPLVDERAVVVENNSRSFATFVSPTVEKGLYFFVGIARELARIRPDVPLLVSKGRADLNLLLNLAKNNGLNNISVANLSNDPRSFYVNTRILLVPSLCEEAFGRVALEGSINRIPVLCSNRGALPEIVGESSCVLDVDRKYQPTTRVVPDASDVQAWTRRVIELWDDDRRANEVGARLAEGAKRYRRELVADQVVEFFDALARGKR